MIIFDGTKNVGPHSFLVFKKGEKRVEIPIADNYKHLFLKYLEALGIDKEIS